MNFFYFLFASLIILINLNFATKSYAITFVSECKKAPLSSNITDFDKKKEKIIKIIKKYYSERLYSISVNDICVDKIEIGSNVLSRGNYTEKIESSCIVLEIEKKKSKDKRFYYLSFIITPSKEKVFECSTLNAPGIHSHYCYKYDRNKFLLPINRIIKILFD